MPCWDFKCTECGGKIEDVIEPYKEAPEPRECPECHKLTAIRQDFYQTWFSLQGMGWGYGASNCQNFKV